MPNSTLPPDNYLGDPERTTGEFQDQINNLQNWVNALQAELQALSGTTVREGAVRDVGNTGTQLRQADSFGSAADVEADQDLQTTDSVSFSDVAADSGDFVDLKESGQDVSRNPGTSTDPGLGLNTWRTPNTSRPTIVYIVLNAETDGSVGGFLQFEVDESGGTTGDYFSAVTAPSSLGSASELRETITAFIPPGGSYRVENVQDPNNGNAIFSHREFTI